MRMRDYVCLRCCYVSYGNCILCLDFNVVGNVWSFFFLRRKIK